MHSPPRFSIFSVILFGSLFCCLTASFAQAEPPKKEDPKPEEPSPKLRWSYGIRLVTGDVSRANETTRFRPSLGLEWGRWRFGSVDSDQFVGADSLQRSASLSYGVVENPEMEVRASMRLHNLRTGGDIDALASGVRTLRGRLGASRKLDAQWSLFGESTLDLLGKGDGFTTSAGVGRLLHRTTDYSLSASVGLKFAGANHWRNAYAANPRGENIQAGIGETTLGFGLRGRLGKAWGYQAATNTSWPVGPVRAAVGGQSSTGVQVGVQRFVN